MNIREKIQEFVGNDNPYMLADVNQFDWMGICRLFGIYNVPFFYIPIDLSSILFAKGIDPDVNREEFAASLGIDVTSFKKHHALDDARIVKAIYDEITYTHTGGSFERIGIGLELGNAAS